jgi:SanA protein
VRCLGKLFLLGVLVVFAFVFFCQWLVIHSAEGRLYDFVQKIPAREVGLVLGTNEKLGDGKPNPFFDHRITAAAELFKAGKVKHLLLSGANPDKTYDEPSAMKRRLLQLGVPEKAMTLDFAGRRTLDSIVRAQEVFGLTKCTIISQKFHNQRSLLLARHYGLDAIGFNAAAVPARYAMRIVVREWFARVKAVLDLYLLQTAPHFLGERHPI